MTDQPFSVGSVNGLVLRSPFTFLLLFLPRPQGEAKRRVGFDHGNLTVQRKKMLLFNQRLGRRTRNASSNRFG